MSLVTQTKMEEEKKVVITPHAIMIAIPYQGHLSPFVHLAIKLASHGIPITFVNTEYGHYQITKSHQTSPNNNLEIDIFSEARNSGLNIRYTTISDGFPLDFDRSANHSEYWVYMLNEFPSLVHQFVGRLIESDPSMFPFMIADTVATWPRLIAKKLNMVYVSFWTQAAVAFALNYYMDLLSENGHFPCLPGNQDSLINYIPGVESIHAKDLMSQFHEIDPTIISVQVLIKVFKDVREADFVLHNTVQELESDTLAALDEQNPTYAIGPINFSFDKINVWKSLLSETDCTKWMNSKPLGSVLYVSFGSLVQIRRQVILEVAKGLQLSKVNFLWAIRPQIIVEDGPDVLPDGFEDDVKDRGLIVPWCDQKAVLSNPAVGGFLTHCGWNSILEGVWFGVPMICYPVSYDQPTNRKLVVDDWKIAINLCDGAAVNAEEVALKIKRVMSGETSDCVRNEMKFKKTVHNAWSEDGSSERNLNRFLKDLKDKMHRQRLENV